MRPRANEASSAASGGVEPADAARDLGLRRHVHVVFGKVDAGFEQRDQLDQRLLHAAATRRLSAPPIWLAAWRAWVSVCASIRSRTASACVRSSLPERNARCVNSPGSASRAPSCECAPQQQIEHHRRAVRGNLDQIFAGIGVGRGEQRHQRFVDACRRFDVLGVQHIGEARTRVFQRLAQANQLRGNRSSLRPAEAHDADAATPRRRGDGGDGVDDRCCYLRHFRFRAHH